jgi:hypothetical protein
MSEGVDPMSHLVVDGMNVIGTRPDGWWRDLGATVTGARHLLDRLDHLDGAS